MSRGHKRRGRHGRRRRERRGRRGRRGRRRRGRRCGVVVAAARAPGAAVRAGHEAVRRHGPQALQKLVREVVEAPRLALRVALRRPRVVLSSLVPHLAPRPPPRVRSRAPARLRVLLSSHRVPRTRAKVRCGCSRAARAPVRGREQCARRRRGPARGGRLHAHRGSRHWRNHVDWRRCRGCVLARTHPHNHWRRWQRGQCTLRVSWMSNRLRGRVHSPPVSVVVSTVCLVVWM